jgi:hypothetical protein
MVATGHAFMQAAVRWRKMTYLYFLRFIAEEITIFAQTPACNPLTFRELGWRANCLYFGAMNVHLGTAPKQGYIRQRTWPRVKLLVSGKVNCAANAISDHVAFLRDASSDGIFFYSDFVPQIGGEIEITFDIPLLEKSVKVSCRGKVVRVERVASGAAPGIAVRVESRRFTLRH